MSSRNSHKDIFYKKSDFIFIGVVIIIFLIFKLLPQSTANQAAIVINGQNIETVNLNTDKELEIDGISINVSNGKIAVTDSPCKDKICVKTGYISHKNEVIACVPMKLVIEISGTKEVDLIVG